MLEIAGVTSWGAIKKIFARLQPAVLRDPGVRKSDPRFWEALEYLKPHNDPTGRTPAIVLEFYGLGSQKEAV